MTVFSTAQRYGLSGYRLEEMEARVVRRNTALDHYEVLILGSLCLIQCTDAGLCDYTALVQHKQGRSVHLSLFSVGGNSNARLRACMSGQGCWDHCSSYRG